MSGSRYLAFGGADRAQAIDVVGTLTYLKGLGFADGDLHQARNAVQAFDEDRFTFDSLSGNYCDFCFAPIMGGEYDHLTDGRDRCIRCSRTTLSSHAEFQEIFVAVRRNMEIAYDIALTVPMVVRMTNARTIARKSGESFEATPDVDARVLGFAEKSRDGYALHIENGSPKLAAITTIAHELTHIWQYLNWDDGAIAQRFGAHNRTVIYEGMSTWAQIQYLLFIREFAYAARQEAYALERTDEYGIGFRVFADRYPLRRDGDIDQETPFVSDMPL